MSPLCWWSLEYADCTTSGRIEPLSKKRGGVLGMTQKYIWWWDYNSGDLRSVVYLFIAITPRSTLIQNGSTY